MRTFPVCSTTVVSMRPSGTAEQLEKRRRQAIALLQAGTPYREVARRVEAALSSFVRWKQAYRRDKGNGLRARPIPYPTELWTLRRIGEVIQKRFGVRYSPVGVWALLRHGLGWSWQKPERRALQRDEGMTAGG